MRNIPLYGALGAQALLVAACATQAPRPSPPAEAAAVAQAEAVLRAPARALDAARVPTARLELPRRGGYYLDDGPDDDPPEGLQGIPDAQPRSEPLHRFANNPYSVFGQDYVPSTGLKPYRVRGVGSWYGKRFHGQKTSSGERYDMYAMSAAHPTLPIPSYVRVTNVDNGRAVVVRINDRGPFHKGRMIDLSYAAAFKLGYVRQGSAQLLVESIIPEAPSMQATAADGGSGPAVGLRLASTAGDADPDPIGRFASALASTGVSPAGRSQPSAAARGVFLQLGAFASNSNAESLRTMLARDMAWLSGKLHVVPDDGRYRLHAGPFASTEEAGGVAERIRKAANLQPMLVMR
ncbi:MAG: septal ring lytic transglycosylase RlpA family protein [Betaproteobacteria bacterium]|nr:septal ring lytic transglycosylase RlpA family protein [Betaproteobacteria bacterium]